MQASVGGGGSGAAARAAGPDSLPLRERPENACMQRVLREIDGLGFCRSSLAGRRLNPTPENRFEYHESTRIHLRALTFASILPTMQEGLKGGKPWYKGGSDGKMAVWYVDDNADKHHPGTQWVIGFARHVGKMCSSIAATSSAVTPDAVQAGTWEVALP